MRSRESSYGGCDILDVHQELGGGSVAALRLAADDCRLRLWLSLSLRSPVVIQTTCRASKIRSR